jgi:predicted metal-dependent hydrolase
MKVVEHKAIELHRRTVDYRIVRSKVAQKLRVRVGLNGVDVVQPASRRNRDVTDFLRTNENWIAAQLDRVERLRRVRQPKRRRSGEILFRGYPTQIRLETDTERSANKILFKDDGISIWQGTKSRTPVTRSLENWLRKQARGEIDRLLPTVTGRLRRLPRKVYVMGQRTKWGNCSTKQNLSFNWRLVLAPEFVLRYFVTHEVVHLAVPNHSPKFWLTVQSMCPETQKAKQWLRANGHRLMEDVERVCARKR